jgi:F420-dependent methylenetetrahydromethanopterin dehydrogenase
MEKLFTQIGDEVREFTKEELAQYKLDKANYVEQQKLASAEAEAKAIAKTELLERLGLTEDEAKLLLS